jgi:alkylation response protein AidB-like acyl-CoA dehydrogenase
MTAVYELPEEHQDFRSTIRPRARERIAPRAAEIDAADEYPWDIRRLLAEQDVLALPFDEEHGGTGTGTLMLQVAVEELARASAACAPARAASGRRRSACRSPMRARTRPRCARPPCATATSG